MYRGYGAPPALQRLHDEATQSRVRLQLERAHQQQAQELEDIKLERSLARAAREREQQVAELERELSVARRRQEAELARTRAAADQEEAVATARDARIQTHLASLAALGVDLTAYLTRGGADEVIEVRGGSTPHVHLEPRR